MIPETAFRQGKNDVEVFLVSNVSGRPCLKSIRNQAGFSYTLSASKDREGEVIISSNGTIIPVIPNALELHLDVADRKSGRVLFSGWSVDLKNSQTPESIVFFLDGKFFSQARLK